MIVERTKEFDQSVKKLKDKIAIGRLNLLLEKLKEANNLKEISNIESISGYPFVYRIRTGDYRLIVKYIDGALIILLLEYAKRNEKTYRNYN